MPTLILEDKSEWVVGAPVVAEFERLRAQLKIRHEEWRTAALELVERGAQCDALRTKLKTCSGRYDEVVADRDRMLDSRDEARSYAKTLQGISRDGMLMELPWEGPWKDPEKAP